MESVLAQVARLADVTRDARGRHIHLRLEVIRERSLLLFLFSCNRVISKQAERALEMILEKGRSNLLVKVGYRLLAIQGLLASKGAHLRGGRLFGLGLRGEKRVGLHDFRGNAWR
jgi:hypothetical protein